jgi:hypothetical protein
MKLARRRLDDVEKQLEAVIHVMPLVTMEQRQSLHRWGYVGLNLLEAFHQYHVFADALAYRKRLGLPNLR